MAPKRVRATGPGVEISAGVSCSVYRSGSEHSGEMKLVSDGKATGAAVDSGQKKTSPARVHSKDRDMGSALRSVYQKTVDETVPDEMLALLGKLD